MSKLDKKSIIGISALLVHAAKIDEIYSDHEKKLIKNFIKSYLEEDTNEILKQAEEMENNSNQIHEVKDKPLMSIYEADENHNVKTLFA